MYNIFLDYNISVSRIKFKKFNKIVQNIIIIWYNSILDVVSSAREPARLGSARSSGELQNQAGLGLVLAREPARAEPSPSQISTPKDNYRYCYKKTGKLIKMLAIELKRMDEVASSI
jgi:hypothetical protein